MPFLPFLARVTASRRISPVFQRVTLTGLEHMGPAGPIRDLRVKLIFPQRYPLPNLAGSADWFATWRGLDPAERGDARTYSIRARRGGDIDIDFVLHGGDSAGPASTWAAICQPGDQLWFIGPSADDATGTGIEFQPGDSQRALLFGDETALPAIARTLDEWPDGLTGHAWVEVPTAADAQAQACDIILPDRVELTWLVRDDTPRGQLLTAAVHEVAGAYAAGSDVAVAGEEMNMPDPAQPATAGAAEGFDLVWETPHFSASGENLENAGAGTLASAESTVSTVAPTDYYWIAGESGVVTGMRRYLVKECGIDRRQVSFMGYWRLGRAGS